MAKLRNSHGICPPEILKFLLDLFKYNDNSKNTFSDNYYRACLVDALGETVTPVVSVLQAATAAAGGGAGSGHLITADSLSPGKKTSQYLIHRLTTSAPSNFFAYFRYF